MDRKHRAELLSKEQRSNHPIASDNLSDTKDGAGKTYKQKRRNHITIIYVLAIST